MNDLRNVRVALLASTAAIGLAAAAAPALAQSQSPAAQSPAAQTQRASTSDTVSEITVTARHRNESLQQVPIDVAVVSGDAAAAKNLNDLSDISASVPSVDFRTSASNKDRTIFIRGIGTISTSPGVEPSVSTVVDGVVYARAGMATEDLANIDHIEVLNGPQGTLFGKNASAGVINIVTKNPTPTPQGYISSDITGDGEYRLNAGVSGPLIADKLEGLVSVFDGQYRGNVENLYDHEWVNGYRHDGAHLKLLATPTPNLTLTFAADYTHEVDDTPTGLWVSTTRVAYPTNVATPSPALASLLASQGVTPSADNRTENDNFDTYASDNNGGASLQIDWAFGDGFHLTSITAYRDWRNVQHQDYDQLAAPTASFPQVADIGYLDFNQISEELRVASPKGHFIDYVAGVYYLNAVDHEQYGRADNLIVGGAPANYNGLAHYGSTDNNYAAFGEADINFTKKFRAIIGAREVVDDLSYYDRRVSTAPAAVTGILTNFAAAGSTNQAGTSGRIGLQYDFTPTVTSYVTFSRGYMGPAYDVFFNMSAVNTPPIKPETSNDYEIGLKSELFDRKVQANLSAFWTDFGNYQANFSQLVAGAIVTNLVNAGSVTTRGFEADITAKPVHGLTLTLNGVYDDAYVANFPCPLNAASSCNIDGEPLPFAPRWKTHLEGDYQRPLTDALDLDLESEYNWQSNTQYQLSETPQTIQPAYGILNGSIGILGRRQGWSARLLVKNIANQHYSSYLVSGNLAGVVRWVPRDDNRYFGVNLRKDF
jgi:iron complex outermembrane receptor protein